MINRPLVRRKAMMRLMMRLMPAMMLALIAELILLAVTLLQDSSFSALGVVLPKAENLTTPEALEAYAHQLLSDRMMILKLCSVVVGASLVNFIISAPLRFGTLRWFWQAAQDKSETIGYAINSYGSLREIGRSLWIYIYTGLHYLKWALLLYFPPIALIGASTLLEESGKAGVAFTLASIALILAVVMSVLYIYVTNRFFLAPYLYAGGDVSAVDAVRESRDRMRGQAGGLFVFRFMLVFIEFVATLFCYGAASIIAVPYVNMCEASYAAELILGSEQKKEEVEYTVE